VATALGTVRAGITATFQAFLARYPGVSAARLVQAAGIDLRRMGDPDAVLDQAQWIALLEAAAHATDNPCFAIELAQQVPWKDLGVLGYVVLHSPNVGAALENSRRFLAVQQTGGTLTLEVGPRVARYGYAIVDPRVTEHGQHTESVFALAVRMVREATARATWAPREIAFRHDGPIDDAAHARFFGAPVRFRQRENALVLAAEDLALPFVSADAGLLPVLLAHASECLKRMPQSGAFVDEVRGAVMACISAGEPSIDAVAARLGTSGRSVQRRLQADGLSFKSVVDETRLALSERYLADPALSLTETAFLLGYSDLSAFSRAFRRWTGKTALAFRRAAAAPVDA
jgi:AraC-like DNA-binding protein